MRSLTDLAAEAIGVGNLALAEILGRRALEANPEDVTARLVVGVVLARTKRYQESVECLEKVLSSDPNSVEALTWIGDALRKMRRFEEALKHAEHASHLDPTKQDPIFTAGMCLLAMGRYAEAETSLRRALSLSRTAMSLHYLGAALMRQEKLSESVVILEEARRIEPRQPIHLIAIGQVRLVQRQVEEARRNAKFALALSPDHPGANLLMAQVMAQDGLTNDCEAFLQRALSASPDSAEAHGLMGMLQQQIGRFSEAKWHLDRSLELDPNQATPLFCKVQSQTIQSGDEDIVKRMLERAESPTTSSHERVILEYGLGKAFDDLENPDEAMGHYSMANLVSYEIYRQARPWNQRAFENVVDRAIELFTKSFLGQWRVHGNSDDRPIFVLGMIRSGTTLMEQMLSAHSKVAGAGEVSFWMNEGPKCLDKTGAALDPGSIFELSSRYISDLSMASPDARFITDKMPDNVTVLGFIHACLPNAKIIHMVRDPIDTCLSIWTTYFRKPPEFGNHKGNIIHAFRQHERLREHWRRVLPADRFLEVRYEELTADPESKMREILGFCDLDWDPACIRPQDNARFVSTPSMWRVRRPVDTKSVNKKERYGALLGEFLELENGP